MMFTRKHEPNVLKGMAAGVVGGLVASWTMNQFQQAWSKVAEGVEKRQASSNGNGGGKSNGSGEQNQGEDPTVKTADKLAETVLDRHLTEGEKDKAGPAVHYAFGAVMGGIYGMASEYAPTAAKGQGLPFGTALFLGADEVALPALNLTKSPAKFPLSTHVYGLASHFVYGLTTEWVRRAVRSQLGR